MMKLHLPSFLLGASLGASGAVIAPRLRPVALEIATIHSNIESDVLESKKYPDIRFASTSVTPEGDGYRIVGDLTLHGRTKSISTVARRKNGRFEAEVKLHQPDFGIKPYSAMMGALKVQADVIVTVSVPAS